MTRTFRRLLTWGCLALALALSQPLLHAGAEGDAKSEAPSAGQSVAVRFGAVDAVSGQLSLRVPLGPRLPGRIPMGFTWCFDSQDGLRFNGGGYKPVVWPGGSSSPLTTRVVVGGSPIVFYSSAQPAAMPTAATLIQWATDRGVFAGVNAPIAMSSVVASSDGTKFLVTYRMGDTVYTYRTVVLDGDQAIWTDKLFPDVQNWSGVTHLTNRWGDHVMITETVGAGRVGDPETIVIQNMNRTAQTITLKVAGPGLASNAATAGQDTVTVTNTLYGDTTNTPLPTVTLQGTHRTRERMLTVANPVTGLKDTYYWDPGFFPLSLAVSPASGAAPPPTTFKWTTYTYMSPVSYDSLDEIDHSNGLREAFTYAQSDLHNYVCWNTVDGKWQGLQPYNLDNVNGDYNFVTQVSTTGPGVAQAVKFVRSHPYPMTTGSMIISPQNTANFTLVLHYASATPADGDACRGVRLTHPTYDGSWVGQRHGQAYLFASAAVMGAELIHGSGAVSSTGRLATETVDQATVYSGWDAHSWGNPTGTTADGMPVTLVALKTVVTTPAVVTRTTIAGIPGTAGRDAYGPIQTDEYTEPYTAATAPAVSGVIQPGDFSGTLTLPANGTAHRQGIITRTFDNGAMRLLTGSDHKTLGGGSPLPRFAAPNAGASAAAPTSALTSVDFGTTSYGFDGTGRITSVQGARGGFMATEGRSYMTGLPLISDTLKTLSNSVGAVYANPADHTVQVGKTYTYADTLVQSGPSTVVDKADGRQESFGYDFLGRAISHTDVLKLVTTTHFDAMGRLDQVTAPGTGGGSVVTAHAYDPNGLYEETTVTADGRSLRTHTDLDALGRTIGVTTYDTAGAVATTQTFHYDGFGQKDFQSPVLDGTQTSWGNERWAYDGAGRLTDHYDAQGRLLMHVDQQPTWSTITAPDGVTLTGAVTITREYWDAAQTLTYTRTEVHDALGQKTAVIDQKGQTSRYYYDQDGHLLQTLQGSQQRSYTYNAMGWMTSRTEPEEGTTTYATFTLLGTPLDTTQGGRDGSLSNTFHTTLDAHLQPSQITATGGGSTVTRTFSYDYGTANTHLLTGLTEVQANGTLTESYPLATAYDSLFRLVSKTIGDGTQTFTVSRTLDSLGHELSTTYPSTGDKAAQTVTTTLDARLRPASVSFGGTTRGTMDYEHSISGSTLTSLLTLGNGATTTSTVALGELTHVTHSAAAGVLEDNAVTWTINGLMLTRGADSFDYDELQRLKSAHVQNPSTATFVDQTFTYDRYGNRAGVTTSDPGGALPPGTLAAPREALSWTAPANTTGSNDLPATVTGSSTWNTGVLYDQLGRMTQVWAVPGQSSSLTQWAYDPSGRVMQETVNGVTTRFLLDGEGLRFKRVAADGTPSYTVYGFHREPLAQYTCPLGQVHGGSKAVQIFHRTSNNSSLSRGLGTFTAGDTITVTAWFRGANGTTGQVFLGNVSTTPYTDEVQVKPAGTGAWQQVTLTKTVTVTGPFRIYLYGNTNTTAPDLTSSNYDDVLVSSTQRGTVLSEGFESGLALGSNSNSTTTWYTTGEPTDVDVSGQPGMAEWQRSMVYGFGQLLSEDQVVTGTIYEQGDQVGSPNLITDASGVLKNRSKNLPYGERLAVPVSTAAKSIRRFTNHEDQDGSAIYMQARTYLPSYGKFAQVDPAYDQTKDDPESWNLYNYVTNNPVTHTDPDGRMASVDPELDLHPERQNEWDTPNPEYGLYFGNDMLAYESSPWTVPYIHHSEFMGDSAEPEPGPDDPDGPSDIPQFVKDFGNCAKDFVVNNPITQGYFQVKDTLMIAPANTFFGQNWRMESNLGKASQDGKGLLEVWGLAARGPADVMAAALMGRGAEKLFGLAAESVTGPIGSLGRGAASKGTIEPVRAPKELSAEAQRGIRSLEKQIAKHEAKLQEFRSNPTIKPGMENLSAEQIAAQQARRIHHLESEIKTFRSNIEKLRGED